MQSRLIAIGLALGVAGCGGSVAKTHHTDATGGTSGTSGTGGADDTGATNATGATAGTTTTEPIADGSGSYPAVPAGSGAFFWRKGLGNWFIASSSGLRQDAVPTDEDGQVVWQASDEAGATLDLWAQLNHPYGTPVDLSDYAGIAFDARLTGAEGPLTVGFNANGDFMSAAAASPEQRFAMTGEWQTLELAFDKASTDAGISSIDFIVSGQEMPFDLSIRKLALRCKSRCP